MPRKSKFIQDFEATLIQSVRATGERVDSWFNIIAYCLAAFAMGALAGTLYTRWMLGIWK